MLLLLYRLERYVPVTEATFRRGDRSQRIWRPVFLCGRCRVEFQRHLDKRNEPASDSRVTSIPTIAGPHGFLLIRSRTSETAGTTKSRAMGLQSKSATTTCCCRDIRCRTMPGSSAYRANHSALFRTGRITLRGILVVFRIIPIGDPLPDIAGHIFYTVWRVSIGQ